LRLSYLLSAFDITVAKTVPKKLDAGAV